MKQFLFAVFSETLPDGTSVLSVEANVGKIKSEDFSFSGMVQEDIKILNKLLRDEDPERGIHDLRMQSLAERGIIYWSSSGWRMTEELRKMAAVEMLGEGRGVRLQDVRLLKPEIEVLHHILSSVLPCQLTELPASFREAREVLLHVGLIRRVNEAWIGFPYYELAIPREEAIRVLAIAELEAEQ